MPRKPRRGASLRVPVRGAAGKGTASDVTSLTIHMGETAPPSDDPQWAVDLRAAFTGITYDNTYTVPTGAGYTDGMDCYANVAAFIAGKADGASASHHTRIVFPSGYTYTFSGDNGLHVSGRHNMTFDGTGCTFHQYTTGVSNHSAIFFVGQSASSHIVFRGFTVVGQSPNMGTASHWTDIRERDHGLHIRSGCSWIEMDSVTITQNRGWPVYINIDDGTTWPTDIWIHDCDVEGGETWIAPIAVSRLLIEDSVWDKAALMAIDFEPEYSGVAEGYQDALIQNNVFGSYGWDAPYTPWFLAMNPPGDALASAVMDRLTVRNNTINGPCMDQAGANSGRGGMTIRTDKINVKNDTVITGNVSTSARTATSYPPMQGNAMHNLTLTGNTQITPGALYIHAADDVDVPDSGTITTTPNTTT